MGANGESHLAVAFSDGAVAAVALSETCDALLLPLDAPSWLPAKGRARFVRSCGGFVVAAFNSGAIHAWDVSGDAAGRHCYWVLSEMLAASALHFLEVSVPDKFARTKGGDTTKLKVPGKGLRALTGSALREISIWDLARGQLVWKQIAGGRITAMQLHSESAVVAHGSEHSGGVVKMWAPATGALLWCSAPKAPAAAAAQAAAATALTGGASAAGATKRVKAKRKPSNRRKAKGKYSAHKGHVAAVRCFCVAPPPMRLLISGGDGGRVCVWYVPALQTRPIADAIAGRATRVSMSVATALEAHARGVVRVLKGHEGPVVALRCDFAKIVSAGCVCVCVCVYVCVCVCVCVCAVAPLRRCAFVLLLLLLLHIQHWPVRCSHRCVATCIAHEHLPSARCTIRLSGRPIDPSTHRPIAASTAAYGSGI